MDCHAHAVNLARTLLLALDSKKLYLTFWRAGAAINMRETPGTSGRVGKSVFACATLHVMCCYQQVLLTMANIANASFTNL